MLQMHSGHKCMHILVRGNSFYKILSFMISKSLTGY